jgi:hypothetical protein
MSPLEPALVCFRGDCSKGGEKGNMYVLHWCYTGEIAQVAWQGTKQTKIDLSLSDPCFSLLCWHFHFTLLLLALLPLLKVIFSL